MLRDTGFESVPSKPKRQVLNPLERARRNPKSLRLAINAKCFDCEGQDADPNVQWRIGNCEITDCPLHPVRPYRRMLGTLAPPSYREHGDS